MSENIKKTDKEIIAKFQELITLEVDAESLAETIDEVMLCYAKYLIEDDGFCGNKEGSKQIYWLKTLRDVLMNKEGAV